MNSRFARGFDGWQRRSPSLAQKHKRPPGGSHLCVVFPLKFQETLLCHKEEPCGGGEDISPNNALNI